MSDRLPALLATGKAILMDGAMGTLLLQRLGYGIDSCPWQNLTHPEVVHAIHQEYVAAGATVLLTNTFNLFGSRNVSPLNKSETCQVCSRGVGIARSAGGSDAVILGSIGPDDLFVLAKLNNRLNPLAGVDGFLFETQSTLELVQPTLAQRHGDSSSAETPSLISMTFRVRHGEPETYWGQTPQAIASEIHQLRPLAIGVNCGEGIGQSELIDIVRRYRDSTNLPILARPNAGTPEMLGEGKARWPLTPVDFAEMTAALLDAGVRMIGGCCGTTPAHIAAARTVIDDWNRNDTGPSHG